MTTDKPQSILITGTSSGHGMMASQLLASRGHLVFAGMRDPAGKNKDAADSLRAFGEDSPGQIHVLEMDVTNDEHVVAAAREMKDKAGRIDVAINNAGFVTFGWMEEFSIEEFHEVIDVFLYGAQRVYRAVLPDMRERGAGLIINVTTIGARLAVPLRQGPYTPAKWALEAMSERYHQELEPMGIQSITLQPAVCPGTKLVVNSREVQDPSIREGYPAWEEDRYYRAFFSGLPLALARSEPPEMVAKAIVGLVEAEPSERPVRSVVRNTALIGDAEAELMNETFDKVQTGMLQRWLEGKPGTLWDDSEESDA